MFDTNLFQSEEDLSFSFVNLPTPSGSVSWDVCNISGDGSTAIVANYTYGKVYLFVRSGPSWSLQQTITVTDPRSVALSNDGTYAIIGNIIDGAYIYLKSGSTWSLQQTIDSGDPDFGVSVDINDAGDACVVGTGQGHAYLYTRSGTTWSQSRHFTGAGTNFGSVVRMSGDGNRVFIGSTLYTSGQSQEGAVYAFVNVEGNWGVNIIEGNVVQGRFGTSVDCSYDGLDIIVGHPGTSSYPYQKAHYYRLVDNAWTLMYTFNNVSGSAVAISGDKSIIMCGGVGTPVQYSYWTTVYMGVDSNWTPIVTSGNGDAYPIYGDYRSLAIDNTGLYSVLTNSVGNIATRIRI